MRTALNQSAPNRAITYAQLGVHHQDLYLHIQTWKGLLGQESTDAMKMDRNVQKDCGSRSHTHTHTHKGYSLDTRTSYNVHVKEILQPHADCTPVRTFIPSTLALNMQ